MNDLIDRRLGRYVVESGFHLVPDDDAFIFGDGEMQFYVRRSGDGYEMTEVQRGSTRLVWTTTARSAVDRWLVDTLVADWRDRGHLPWPFMPVALEDVPDSVTVRPTGGGTYELAWSEEGKPRHAEGLRRHGAVAVAHLLQWSMDEILAAVERRDAAPVFSRRAWPTRPPHPSQ